MEEAVRLKGRELSKISRLLPPAENPGIAILSFGGRETAENAAFAFACRSFAVEGGGKEMECEVFPSRQAARVKTGGAGFERVSHFFLPLIPSGAKLVAYAPEGMDAAFYGMCDLVVSRRKSLDALRRAPKADDLAWEAISFWRFRIRSALQGKTPEECEIEGSGLEAELLKRWVEEKFSIKPELLPSPAALSRAAFTFSKGSTCISKDPAGFTVQIGEKSWRLPKRDESDGQLLIRQIRHPPDPTYEKCAFGEDS